MTETIAGAIGIYGAALVVAMVSGVIPLVSSELYLIGLALAIGRIPEALLLALLVAVGQMVGKAFVYQTARGAANLGRKHTEKTAARLERARELIERWRSKPLSVTFISATVSLPPFTIIAVLAGVLEVRFRSFMIVGFAGRCLRFGTLSVLAATV